MKLFLLTLFLSANFAAAALATPGTGVERQNPPASDRTQAQADEAVPSERLIVRNSQGVELGEIVNFLLDTEVGKVAYALVATGEVKSPEDLHIVPVSALKLGDGEIILDMDAEQLANSPMPVEGQDAEEFHRRISEYYGVAPYWEE